MQLGFQRMMRGLVVTKSIRQAMTSWLAYKDKERLAGKVKGKQCCIQQLQSPQPSLASAPTRLSTNKHNVGGCANISFAYELMLAIALMIFFKYLYYVQPISHHTEFLTATILRWQHLLADNNCKQIVLNSLAWLSKEGRCKVYAFVIMPNHIHLIWKISDGFARQEVQAAFLSFTAHEFKKHLSDDRKLLNEYLVNDADRKYQFWERDSRVKECWNENFLLQKLNYIHHNPCQPHWKLSQIPEEYIWSSAAFYETGDLKYPWLCHYKD